MTEAEETLIGQAMLREAAQINARRRKEGIVISSWRAPSTSQEDRERKSQILEALKKAPEGATTLTLSCTCSCSTPTARRILRNLELTDWSRASRAATASRGGFRDERG